MSPFYLGGVCQCPKCGHKQFAGPRQFVPDDEISCLKCGHITTVEKAEEAGRSRPRPGGSEDFTA